MGVFGKSGKDYTAVAVVALSLITFAAMLAEPLGYPFATFNQVLIFVGIVLILMAVFFVSKIAKTDKRLDIGDMLFVAGVIGALYFIAVVVSPDIQIFSTLAGGFP